MSGNLGEALERGAEIEAGPLTEAVLRKPAASSRRIWRKWARRKWHLHHQNQELGVHNLINGAVVLRWAHSNAVQLFFGLQFLYSLRAGIFLKLFNVRENSPADIQAKLVQLA
jgi:hypothetical protein